MTRLAALATSVIVPAGALYGFAPVQTEAALALLIQPLVEGMRALAAVPGLRLIGR